MTYTCLNCGSTADTSNRLCNPASEELDGKFCATSTDQVCDEHLPDMEYTCGNCGGLSPDAEHLCDPKKIIPLH
jgi:DNA-directed RNA polymerase subunit RPC12/RpoP